jgi:GNAT superfamily N-acetyltransferase
MAKASGDPVIRPARSPADYEAYGRVCRQYIDWFRARHDGMAWFAEEIFGHQRLDDELEGLAAKYGPPNGLAMLAEIDGEIVAGGAWRRMSDGVCELKRLYVTDEARGLGMGRKLSNALIASAREHGFHTVRLDTGDRLKEAIALYASMGFRVIPPYQDYPARLMPHLVFMELAL